MFFFANYILLQCDIQPFAEYAVAPHVGAWIETNRLKYSFNLSRSHPMWVRGLKLVVLIRLIDVGKSHPMWVRGLKLLLLLILPKVLTVAPHVGAWIETLTRYWTFVFIKSHPMWVRGLKQFSLIEERNMISRTPCGCVD